MMSSNAVVLNVKELVKHEKYNATFCVYHVQKSLTCTKPESFIPQFVGLGPYHHCIPQPCFDYLKMSALTTLLLNNTNLLTNVVQQLSNSNLASLIRDSYDSTIVFKDDDTLLYLMTVDALFINDLLSNSVIVTENEEDQESVETITKVDLKISIFAAEHGMPLINYGGVEFTKDAIIRDIFMVENQIPIHIVEEIMKVVIMNMESEGEEPHPQYEDIGSKMLLFCRALCPFIYSDQQFSFQSEEAMKQKHVHLLDLMYHLMLQDPITTPDKEDPNNFNHDEHEPIFNRNEYDPNFNPDNNAEQSNSYFTHLKNMFLHPMFTFIVWGTKPNGEPLIEGGVGFISYGRVLQLYAILLLPGICIFPALLFLASVLVTIVLILLLPFLRVVLILLVPLLRVCYPAIVFLHNQLSKVKLPFMKSITPLFGTFKSIYGLVFQNSTNLATVVEMPSVTELYEVGIQFKPAYGIISFSENNVPLEEFIFYLPKIRLDLNSEVIMENLVAYESLTQSNSLYLTRYVELMRSLIKTAEDVKLLVDKKIIHTKLNDAQVMQLFKEISKSIRPTKTPNLEQIIERVNYVFRCLGFEKCKIFLIHFVFFIWIAFSVAIYVFFFLVVSGVIPILIIYVDDK